jgi:hypothetical protein
MRAALANDNGRMSTTLPGPIAQQVLDFPEWKMGVHRIKVTLIDGRVFAPVDVAWGRDVVRVAGSDKIPFDAGDVNEVEDLSGG